MLNQPRSSGVETELKPLKGPGELAAWRLHVCYRWRSRGTRPPPPPAVSRDHRDQPRAVRQPEGERSALHSNVVSSEANVTSPSGQRIRPPHPPPNGPPGAPQGAKLERPFNTDVNHGNAMHPQPPHEGSYV